MQYLEALRHQIREQLKLLAHAPSVQFFDAPPTEMNVEHLIREQLEAEAARSSTVGGPAPLKARLARLAEAQAGGDGTDQGVERPHSPLAVGPATDLAAIGLAGHQRPQLVSSAEHPSEFFAGDRDQDGSTSTFDCPPPPVPSCGLNQSASTPVPDANSTSSASLPAAATAPPSTDINTHTASDNGASAN